MEKILFSTPELAHFLGVFHTTIRRWIERGKIRGIRVGRNYKIPADEVIRILDDHNLPLPESLRKYKLRLINEGEGLSAAGHHASVLEKLLIVEEIEDPGHHMCQPGLCKFGGVFTGGSDWPGCCRSHRRDFSRKIGRFG